MLSHINSKLNSKRGVSIMLALLLFLVCVLAGAAAITAAGSNIGRHAYMRSYQQQYLAASSAARLVLDQLEDGANLVTAEFNTASNPINAQYLYNGNYAGPDNNVYKLIWTDIQKMINIGFRKSSAVSDDIKSRAGSLPIDLTSDRLSFTVTVDDEVFEDVVMEVLYKPSTSALTSSEGDIYFQFKCGDYAINFKVGYVVKGISETGAQFEIDTGDTTINRGEAR